MPTCLFRTAALLALSILGVSGAAVASAAAGAAPAAGVQTEVQGAIEAARSAIEVSALDEAQRQLAYAQLDAATSQEREAEALLARRAALHAEAAQQPARMRQLRESLAIDRDHALEEWAARLPADADRETLERVLDQERNIVAGLSAQIDEIASELARALARPIRATSEIANLRQRAEELSAATVKVETEPALLADARDLRREAELRRVQAELELRLLEVETGTQRQRLQELSLRELRFRQALDLRRVALLQERIADLGRRELEALIARLGEQEAALSKNRGVEAETAKENRALGEELIAQNERLTRDRKAVAAAEESRERIAASLRDTRTRLEAGAASEAVGRWLWSERRNLESPARLKQRLEFQRSELAELRLRLVVLSEQKRDLQDIPEAAGKMIEASHAESDDDGAKAIVAETLEPLLSQRAELLEPLDPLLRRRIAALEQSEAALQEQIANVEALQQLLDRHLLWTPSHTAIDATWLQRVPEGLKDLVKPSRLAKTLELAWREIGERPWPWLASLVLLVALCELRRRAPAIITAQAEATHELREDSYRATLLAFAWTLVAALPGPAVLAVLGVLLQSVGNPGRYSDSLGRACTMLVVPLFGVQVLRWTTIARGLADEHFGWMPARREALSYALPRAALIVLPTYFVSTLAFIRNLDLPNDVQARVAVVLGCGTLAWTLWRLLDVGRVWEMRGVEAEPSSLRKLLRIALPTAALVVGLLALTGYVYSAGILIQALLASFSVVVAVALLLGLLARWFLLGEQRLSRRRLEEHPAPAPEAASVRGDTAIEADSDLSLEQVNAQTGRLLRALRLSLLSLGLIWVWAEVMPAVARLDEIELWTFTETGADGATLQQPVSLIAALLGFVALALTVISARNLPGLIEIGLLRQTRIDAASRYAITSILRYAIVITGTLIGLNMLGLRWSQLQWMAAALTVGLGFGLQEIFANFVSGLILLFERPFRVGDVITVGDLPGRVTRIRTRATTILDFDNKEIVVPNKNFITSQLINWTLSDTTTRITVKVGVAYGTAPERVHELLLQAAAENPRVLDEPESRSWFLAFGASSLDFELRVYVGTLNDRLQTQHELNIAIARLFRDNDIEIAFPQLDVHVRDWPASGAPAGPGEAPPKLG